jgi:Domain of unknown function (DUF4917)
MKRLIASRLTSRRRPRRRLSISPWLISSYIKLQHPEMLGRFPHREQKRSTIDSLGHRIRRRFRSNDIDLRTCRLPASKEAVRLSELLLNLLDRSFFTGRTHGALGDLRSNDSDSVSHGSGLLVVLAQDLPSESRSLSWHSVPRECCYVPRRAARCRPSRWARHLLLGNGFSIACRPDCFTYGALLDEADFSGASTNVRVIFDLLGTVDFEKVIEALRLASRLVELYAGEPSLRDRLRDDAAAVRESLARVLAAKHPDLPFDIALDEYVAARAFLAHFARVYTVNYDMLLYWTLMQDIEPYINRNDGFGNPKDPDESYVAWQPYETFTSQRVFYMHGGLHLYDSGAELAKITYSRTGTPLVDQIRLALEDGRFPLVVTEGTSTEKTRAILHHAYLPHAIRRFGAIAGSLFVYGFSLAPNDEHILRRIEAGKMANVYVRIYGDLTSDINTAIASRAVALGANRPAHHPLTIHFYDAESAHVWR